METIGKAFTLGTKYLSKVGYTISLNDLNVLSSVKKTTDEVIKEGEDKTNKIIEDYNGGTMEVIPGKTPEETLPRGSPLDRIFYRRRAVCPARPAGL